MKRLIKKFSMVLSVAVFVLGLTACGKDETPAREFVYIPEYVDLELKCDYLDSVLADGDMLYLFGTSWNEEDATQSAYLYQYDLLNGTTKEIPMEMNANSNISQMALDGDGNLLAITTKYEEILDDNGEVAEFKQTLELQKISKEDGKVLDSKDITGLMGDQEYAYIQYFCVDGQGNLYFTNGESSIKVTDKELNPVCDVPVDNWINEMEVSKEGTVYISAYGERGIEFRPVDITKKALGEALSGLEGYGNLIVSAGTSKSLVISNDESVSVYDVATSTGEEKFKWLDADVNSNNIRHIGETSDGRIWSISENYDGESWTAEILLVKEVKASEVEPREEITYGGLYLDSRVKESIIKFNKTNEKYRIVFKSYETEDYETGLTQFHADLTSANCPDIIDLSHVNYSMYASKGILEDLYPYMEKSGMKKEDYLDNVLGAYEVDGKLYGLISQFYINTTAAKAANVGDISGWTLGEMLDYAQAEGAEKMFAYGDRSNAFYYCIYNNIDEFINWETGECNFKGEEFIRTLEFAMQFPAEFNYNEEVDGIHSRLHNNEVLLLQTSVSSVQEFQMYQGMFGEKIAYVGSPNSKRQGNMISPTGGSMGMSARSKNKEGAWEFMQTLLSEEYQQGLVVEYGNWGFPVKISALEAQFALDMKPDYYTDENGKQIEQPKTSWGYDDFNMDIYAATEEEIAHVRALIDSASKLSGSVNQQLAAIITEESEAFFNGQKSAEATADVIQNRIQIYVNENR